MIAERLSGPSDGSRDRLIVGLMTGNSLDGISAALVATRKSGSDRSLTVAAYLNYPISTDMRQRLLSFHIPNAFRANDLMTVHTDFGEVLALAATAVMERGGARPDEVSVIGVQAANLIHAIAGSRANRATVTSRSASSPWSPSGPGVRW